MINAKNHVESHIKPGSISYVIGAFALLISQSLWYGIFSHSAQDQVEGGLYGGSSSI
jgi:hypothetical protein